MPEISVPSGLDTRRFLLEPGALSKLPDFLHSAFPGRIPWIVADWNTWRAAGQCASELLKQDGSSMPEPFIFPGEPRLHPDFSHVKKLAELIRENYVPVAIGSGVINDLVKCASGERGVTYCCVPTACSVDGYTSTGASLSVNGTKMTVQCPAPRAVCADSLILASAPPEMFASGYADLLTKIPAGADWIIADEIGMHPIRQDVWQFIQGNIRRWTSDRNNLLNVFEGLAATGYSMQMMHDSRPASGAEHLFSHVWEMEGLQKDGEEVSHGFKVGVGLLSSVLLMEFAMEQDFNTVRKQMRPGLSIEAREKEIDTLLLRGCYGDAPKKTALAKFLSGAALTERRDLIGRKWENLRRRLRQQLPSYTELRSKLSKAGCPVTPAEIGLSREQYLHGIRTAQLIRNRYTILDLLYELGVLEAAMEKLNRIFR